MPFVFFLFVVAVIPLLLKRGAQRAGFLTSSAVFLFVVVVLETATPHPNPLPQGAREKGKRQTAFKYPVGFADYPFSTKRGIKTKTTTKR
jgi:hypothetical protein